METGRSAGKVGGSEGRLAFRCESGDCFFLVCAYFGLIRALSFFNKNVLKNKLGSKDTIIKLRITTYT